MSYTIDEAVRDITKVGVCPAPKSKVREIVAKVLESHSTSLVRQLLEAFPDEPCAGCKKCVFETEIRSEIECDGTGKWQSKSRADLIAKAIQLGVVEKE